MLSVLAAYDVGEDLILGKNSEFSRLSELRVGEGFFEVDHPNLLFLRPGVGWSSTIESLSSLPFLSVTDSDPWDGLHQRIFLLGPKSRRWL